MTKQAMIDMTTKYQTRSGLKARVLCVDLCAGDDIDTQYTVVAAITKEDGRTYLNRLTKHGHCYTGSNHPHDLVPAPEKVTCWTNVYKYPGYFHCGKLYMSEQDALDSAKASAIAIAVPLTFTIAEDETHDEVDCQE